MSMSDNIYTRIEVSIYRMGGPHVQKRVDIDGESSIVLAGLAQAVVVYGPTIAIEAKREFEAQVASLEN